MKILQTAEPRPMRLRIVSRPGEGEAYRREYSYVEDMETGSRIQGVVSVEIYLTCKERARAIIEVHDFDFEGSNIMGHLKPATQEPAA